MFELQVKLKSNSTLSTHTETDLESATTLATPFARQPTLLMTVQSQLNEQVHLLTPHQEDICVPLHTGPGGRRSISASYVISHAIGCSLDFGVFRPAKEPPKLRSNVMRPERFSNCSDGPANWAIPICLFGLRDGSRESPGPATRGPQADRPPGEMELTIWGSPTRCNIRHISRRARLCLPCNPRFHLATLSIIEPLRLPLYIRK